MSQEEQSKVRNKDKMRHNTKTEFSEEHRFIKKSQKLRKKTIENMRVEEKWQEWDDSDEIS
jgi:hypothetical protein